MKREMKKHKCRCTVNFTYASRNPMQLKCKLLHIAADDVRKSYSLGDHISLEGAMSEKSYQTRIIICNSEGHLCSVLQKYFNYDKKQEKNHLSSKG